MRSAHSPAALTSTRTPVVPAAVSTVTPPAPRGRRAARAGRDLDAARPQDLGQPPRDRGEVGDARLGHPEALDARGVRLVLADALGAESDRGHAVGLGARRRAWPAAGARRRSRPRSSCRSARTGGPRPRRTPPSVPCPPAQARLAAARRVVQAGVQHARVAPALVLCHGRLLLQQDDAEARPPFGDLEGRRQPDEAAADDADVVGGGEHGCRNESARPECRRGGRNLKRTESPDLSV